MKKYISTALSITTLVILFYTLFNIKEQNRQIPIMQSSIDSLNGQLCRYETTIDSLNQKIIRYDTIR
jgi:peptidoglycan hydrolase CwlO-like protein